TIYLSGIVGMRSLNNRTYRITVDSDTKFYLNGVDTRNGTYRGGGTAQKCLNPPNCDVTITSASHGFSSEDYVHITGVNNMGQLNNGTFRVARLSQNTFSVAAGAGGSYASGGTAYCTKPGCEY